MERRTSHAKRLRRAAELAATVALASCDAQMLVGTMKGDDLADAAGLTPAPSDGGDASFPGTAVDGAVGDIAATPDAAGASDTRGEPSPPDPPLPDGSQPPDDVVYPDSPPGDVGLPDGPLADGALCPSSARAPVACLGPDASTPETPLETCPFPSRLLHREPNEVHALHADALGLYWLGGDSILRFLPKGAAAPQPLALVASQPFTIDDDAMYFAIANNASAFDIRKMKRDGTGLTFLASGAMAQSEIGVGGDRVYFQEASDKIGSVTKAGGPVQTLAAGGRVQNIVVDASHVYWMEPTSDASTETTSAIWRAAHGSSAKELVASGLAVDVFKEQGDELILFSQRIDVGSGDDVASIRELPKAGGCARVLVALPKSRCSCRVTALAVDARAIYWRAAGDAGDFSIWYTPRSGGIAVKMSDALDDENIALTPTQVHWADMVPEVPLGITTFDSLVQVADRP